MISMNLGREQCDAGDVPLESDDESGRLQLSSSQNSVNRPKSLDQCVSNPAYPFGSERDFLPHPDCGDSIFGMMLLEGDDEARVAERRGRLESREFRQGEGSPVAIADRSGSGDCRVAM